MPSSIAQKLKIKVGDALLTIHTPSSFKKDLGPIPEGVKISSSVKNYQQVHWFVTSKLQVEKETKKILSLVKDNVICWIYFPKGSSGIQTDLTRDKGWDSLLAHSDKLTWLSLVSFNDTWSAFAFRLSTNIDQKKKITPADRPILPYIDPATKTVRLPEDLLQAFKKYKKEETYFNSLAYSHRKEYVEWIVTAKQEATRNKRIEGTIERLQKSWKNPRNL